MDKATDKDVFNGNPIDDVRIGAYIIKDNKLYQVILSDDENTMLRISLNAITGGSIKVTGIPICEVRLERGGKSVLNSGG